MEKQRGRPKLNTDISLTETISKALKNTNPSDKGGFNLEAFKKSKYLDKGVKFKEQRWIPFSKALQKALSIPGTPMGHITLVRGHSDTGKTTVLLETAVSAQKMGILPIFIITEMKWSWEHARLMGFEIEEVVDEDTGEVLDYKGFFMYVDRSSLNSIEDVSSFIADILNEQSKGKLPYDLMFLWDSVGSIPCQMSIDQGKNNPMWNAGAMATQFGNFINQRFPMSRKENYPYTNSLLIINKVGVMPAEGPMSKPKMTNKCGNAMYWDASIAITFGNITNSGTSKIKAVKGGKDVEFAKKTKIAVDKNHITGIQTKTILIVTPHGFIEGPDSSIKKYKTEHSSEWVNILGEGEFEVIEDKSEWEESTKNIPLLSIDEESNLEE